MRYTTFADSSTRGTFTYARSEYLGDSSAHCAIQISLKAFTQCEDPGKPACPELAILSYVHNILKSSSALPEMSTDLSPQDRAHALTPSGALGSGGAGRAGRVAGLGLRWLPAQARRDHRR